MIKGVLQNTMQAPSVYRAVGFTQDAYGQWWGPKGRATPGGDGYFEISGWAQVSGDANAPIIGVYVLPAGQVNSVPVVAGSGLPPNVMSAQVASATSLRSAAQPMLPPRVQWTPLPGAGQPPPPTGGGGTASGGGATGGATWPPGGPTAPITRSGGTIAFAGRNWVVKDSSGGAVGPGPNQFVGDGRYVWVDNAGLHLNVRPQSGCSGWASSEIYTDQPLGYGT